MVAVPRAILGRVLSSNVDCRPTVIALLLQPACGEVWVGGGGGMSVAWLIEARGSDRMLKRKGLVALGLAHSPNV